LLQAEDGIRDRNVTGVQTCALPISWYHGHYTAHKHLAQEPDLDLVLFLGDYIYEYGITPENMWRQGADVGPAHSVEAVTLEQYRSEERRVGKECGSRGGEDAEGKHE